MPRRPPSALRKKHGYSLVELLVVISIISFLFTGIGLTLHTFAKLNRKLRTELPESEMLTRLSLALRTDAHASIQWTAKLSEPPRDLLRLTQPDESVIEYETQPQRILRRHLRGNDRVHQEVFRLPTAGSAQWSIEDGPPRMLTLRIEKSAGSLANASDDRRVIRLSAALGLHAKSK